MGSNVLTTSEPKKNKIKGKKSSASNACLYPNVVFTLLFSRITDARVDGNVMNEPSDMWTGLVLGF